MPNFVLLFGTQLMSILLKKMHRDVGFFFFLSKKILLQVFYVHFFEQINWCFARRNDIYKPKFGDKGEKEVKCFIS
jgi:hypothetical protein